MQFICCPRFGCRSHTRTHPDFNHSLRLHSCSYTCVHDQATGRATKGDAVKYNGRIRNAGSDPGSRWYQQFLTHVCKSVKKKQNLCGRQGEMAARPRCRSGETRVLLWINEKKGRGDEEEEGGSRKVLWGKQGGEVWTL